MIAWLFPLFVLLLIEYSIIQAKRNQAVYEYRRNLILELDMLYKADVALGGNWRWRYNVFHSVEYSDMMLKFWKPLDSFYPDKSFLDPTITKREP